MQHFLVIDRKSPLKSFSESGGHLNATADGSAKGQRKILNAAAPPADSVSNQYGPMAIQLQKAVMTHKTP